VNQDVLAAVDTFKKIFFAMGPGVAVPFSAHL
jgi:hypothetical protein